jgi:hypothetical protein
MGGVDWVRKWDFSDSLFLFVGMGVLVRLAAVAGTWREWLPFGMGDKRNHSG